MLVIISLIQLINIEMILAVVSVVWRYTHTLLVGLKWYSLLPGQVSILHQSLRMLHCLGPNCTVGIFPKEISQIYLKK